MRSKKRKTKKGYKMGLPDLPPLVTSWLIGLVCGFVVSMPIGPINITIINDGARRGFFQAWLIGLGAVTIDMVYCSIGLAGFTTIFESRIVKACMELGSFVLVFILGLKYLFAKPIAKTPTLEPSGMEKKFHPHSAFMIGLVRVIGNPAVLLFWITMAATFSSHDWVADNWQSRASCVAGIGLGAALWFLLISYVVTRLHKRVSPNALNRLSQISGASLLVLSIVIGFRIAELLAKRT